MQILRHLLWPIALAYGAVIWLRNRMFDLGVLHSRRFDVPIISIGNLEMGGTGKSPLVLEICAMLRREGLEVALLSRGYGRRSSGFHLVNGAGTAAEFGDEPMQAKLRIPELTVAVCENRGEGVRTLLESDRPPQVIVMDDAFQHRWVRPSLSILITSGAHPFWRNTLFPVGSLREWASGAERADALVIAGNNSGSVSFDGPVFRVAALRSEPHPFHSCHEPLGKGDRVLLLSGIARSWRFRDTAAESFSVLAHHVHPDHHFFTEKDMIALRDAFYSFDPPAKAVMITDKDAARLHNGSLISVLNGIPVFSLRISMNWEDNDEAELNQLILRHARTDQ